MIPDFLTLPDRRLAYQHLRGDAGRPGVVFLCGYASDMLGTKAEFLAENCAREGVSFTRFDYRGNGQSSGDFLQSTLGDWFQDACEIFDRLTHGPQVVVGSSMGGWLALMLARDKPARVKALVGIAAGPDFTEDLEPHLTPEQRAELKEKGITYSRAPAPADPLPITQKLLDDAKKHLLLHTPLKLECPVRLIQGMRDEDVPWKQTLRIAGAVMREDVRITLIKDGGHRLSRPEDLALIWQTVKEFL